MQLTFMTTTGEDSGFYVLIKLVGSDKQATVEHRHCLYQFISVVMIHFFHSKP